MTGVTAASVPRTLYVAPTGSDAGTCTLAAPCLTIGHAVAAAAPGDTIVVEAGTCHEAVVVGKRLTLAGHHAIIDAAGILASVPGPRAANGIIGWGVLIVGPDSAGSVTTSAGSFSPTRSGRPRATRSPAASPATTSSTAASPWRRTTARPSPIP